MREFKNAVKDPFSGDARLDGILRTAEEGKIGSHEPWVLMPREAIREARAQINPERNILTGSANAFSRISNRLILGTNPAWAVAQIVAEGIPLALAKPSLLNPLKVASLERDVLRFRKEHPEQALALQGTVGASPTGGAALRTPLDQIETYTPALWEQSSKALTRGKTARHALSFAKLRALGELDVRRQNEYRTLLAAAEADKRFRSFHGAVAGLFDRQSALSKRFRGKSRDELWHWLTTDPKGKAELHKLADYVDNIQGNWTSFTRYERQLAPLTIFYPFLRYSIRWTLWTFPRTHPVVATLAYTLGEANANELEQIVGGKLASPFAYAYPVYTNERGEKAVLPGGSRISPGQSAITSALSEGESGQLLQAANPFLAAAFTALGGPEPLSGRTPTEPRGWAALGQLLAMPAPLRARLLGGESAGEKLTGALSGDKERSAASKAFEALDPNKTRRSLLFPFIPQSAARFKAGDELAKAFDAKYGGPIPSLDRRIWEAAYAHDWKAAKRLRRERVEAERGGDRVKQAEAPFLPPSEDLGEEGSEILRYITGKIEIPVEDEKPSGGFYPSQQSAKKKMRRARRIAPQSEGFYPSQRKGGEEPAPVAAGGGGFWPSER